MTTVSTVTRLSTRPAEPAGPTTPDEDPQTHPYERPDQPGEPEVAPDPGT